MTQLRRVRAGFTVSVVAGGLWALAGGVTGAALILQDATGSLLYTLLMIAACAAVPGFIGLIGGGFSPPSSRREAVTMASAAYLAAASFSPVPSAESRSNSYYSTSCSRRFSPQFRSRTRSVA